MLRGNRAIGLSRALIPATQGPAVGGFIRPQDKALRGTLQDALPGMVDSQDRTERAKQSGLLRAVFQHLLGVEVAHCGLVVQHFIVGIFQHLRPVFTQRLANGLLNARIVQFALACRLP